MIARPYARLRSALLFVVLVVAVSGCDEKLQDLTGPSSPNLVPTFASIRTEIFQTTDLLGRTSCITCHTDQGRNPAGGLNLRADPYAALVNVPSREKPQLMRVQPGAPDNSYLIHKLEGGPDILLLRMPANGPPYLTAAQILVIRRWIENGAPND
jgi:hypothetical protein